MGIINLQTYKINKEIKKIFNDILEMAQRLDFDDDRVFMMKGEFALNNITLGNYHGFQVELDGDFTYRYIIEPRFDGCIAFVEYLVDDGDILERNELKFFDFMYNLFNVIELTYQEELEC